VASAVIAGSTDNFVVRMSEDSAAKTKAESALLANTPNMQNIKYFPFDLSLYDQTGNVKITDTAGLKLTFTIPIPDGLQQYGGNVKVAAIEDDGSLNNLSVKFTTITRVPCVTFAAPHFSPYVMYVDMDNLVYGSADRNGDGLIDARDGYSDLNGDVIIDWRDVPGGILLDDVPPTGDLISPRLMLAAAMIFLSLALFLIPDRKRRVVKV